MLDVIPKRYVLSLFGICVTMLNVALQTNISLCIVYMVKRKTNSTGFEFPKNFSFSHKNEHNGQSYATKTSGEFDWNPQLQGVLVGCQFVTVIIGIFVGGRLAEVYGAKIIMTVFVFLSSVSTILTPAVARWSVYALVVSRLLVGLGTGPILSILIVLMSNWIPHQEQNLTASIVFAGFCFGAFVSYITAGVLCESPTFGWTAVFYLGGLSGILFCPWCYFVLMDTPQMHQSISPNELDYILKNLGPKKQKVTSVPWKSILTSVPFWALALGTFGQMWIMAYYQTSVSMYLGKALRMESSQNGFLSSLANIIQGIGAFVAGIFTDLLTKRRNVPKVFIRKGATLVSSACACVGFVGLMLSGTDVMWNTVFIMVGAVCSDFCTFGVFLGPIDMAPNLEGTISGLLFGLGNIPFALLPALIGYLTRNDSTTLEWRNVYYCSIAIIGFTTAVYLLFGSSTPQPWAIGEAKESAEVARKEKLKKSNDAAICNVNELLSVDSMIVSTHL